LSDIPICKYCGREMKLNPAMSTRTVQQYLCACQGFIYHVNVPNWKPPLELHKPRK
jgi:hypothetical protein